MGYAVGIAVIVIGLVLITFNSNKRKVQGYIDDMTTVVANLSDGELALYNNNEISGLDCIQLIKDHALSGTLIPEDVTDINKLSYPVYAYTKNTADGQTKSYYRKDGIPIYLDTEQTPKDLSDDILITRATTEIYDKTSSQFISKHGKFISALVTDKNVSETLTTADSVKYIVFSQVVTEVNSEARFVDSEESTEDN